MTRKIMTGNEAIARGAFEAGVTVGTAYPGTPSTEILENLARYPGIECNWSTNEKVALEVAIGASLEGTRVLAAMKHVGVNVAADPLLTLSYIGVGGGLVLVSADDPGMHSSQNEQDNRHYARFAKIPLLEPSDSQEAKNFVIVAMDLSEEYDTPVMLRTTTRISHSRTVVELGKRKTTGKRKYQKRPTKHVMLPAFARERHPFVEKRLLALANEADKSPFNRMEAGSSNKIGIICSGIVYQYVKEAFPFFPVLKLGFTYPLPVKLIKKFCSEVETVLVIEELDPFMAEQIKAHGISISGHSFFAPFGELSPEIIRDRISRFQNKVAPVVAEDPLEKTIPQRPPILCPGCSHRGIFYVLKQLKLRVVGDIGCYTLAALYPLQAIDTCVCMGASIGMALGMEKADPRTSTQTVAVIGDSTFLHSGITPLVDAVYNDSSLTVIILDNNTTGMTGHQEHPGTGTTLQGGKNRAVNIAALCRGLGIERVVETDTSDLGVLRQMIETEAARGKLSVIVYRRPCILKSRTFSDPLHIDPEKCNGCKTCLQPGCPSICFLDGKALIDPDTCTGCGLCRQLCKRDAIGTRKKGGNREHEKN